MIVIEPVGVQIPLQERPRFPVGIEVPLPERPRYPGKIITPIIVPPSPEGSERPLPERKRSSLWFWGLLVGVLALGSSASKAPRLGEAKRRSPYPTKAPTNRLYYMWLAPGKWYQDAISIPKSKLPEYQERALTTPGSLYYIWAESADHARYYLRTDPKTRHTIGPGARRFEKGRGEKAIEARISEFIEEAEEFLEKTRKPKGKARKAPESQLTLFGQVYPPGTQTFYVYKPKSGRARIVEGDKWAFYEDLDRSGKGSFYVVPAFTSSEALRQVGRGILTARQTRQERARHSFSGRIANCAIWIPNKDETGYTCGMYGRVCDSPTCVRPPDPEVKQTKVCVRTQKVFSGFYNKMIKRCKRYEATCEGPACMDFTMPYPTAEPEPKKPTEKPEARKPTEEQVRDYAAWMADQWNEEHFEKVPYLAREILSRGGIAPFKYPTETWLEEPKRADEEYVAIPLFLRNKRGLPCDEMASEMGYKYCDELREEIFKAYPPKERGAWKKIKRKTWRDYEDEARWEIQEKIYAGEWFGFPGLAGSLGVRYQKGDINSAIRAAIKTTGDRPLYIFPTYYGYEIKRSVPSWLSHYKVHPDGRVEEHTRDVRTGKWTVERLRRTGRQEPEQLRLLGQEQKELFPGLRRELKLEPAQDPATSDDPVIACMERLGWTIPRMEQLKASISEKLTPDLFTGKIKRLSPGERDYQRVMSECLAASSGIAGFELLGRRPLRI